MKKTFFCNLPLQIAILGLSACVASATANAAVHWSSNFSDPSYTLGESPIGINGWTWKTIDSENDNDATIVTSPDGSGKPMLRLISSSSEGPAARRSIIMNDFEPIEGEKVSVHIPVIYDWTGKTVTQVMSFSFAEDETLSPIIVRFSTDSGIHLAGGYSGLTEAAKTLLAGDLVKANSLYDFNITFDFTLKKFDLTVTGVDVNDNPFSHSLEGIGFKTNHNQSMTGIDFIRLANFRGELMSFYVGDIEVQSIPEGSTVAYIALGGLFALWRGTRRRLKPTTH